MIFIVKVDMSLIDSNVSLVHIVLVHASLLFFHKL